MNVFKFIAAIISLGQVLSAIPVINVHAEDIFTDYNDFPSIHDQVLSEGIQFLRFKQDPTRIWDTPDSNETYPIFLPLRYQKGVRQQAFRACPYITLCRAFL